MVAEFPEGKYNLNEFINKGAINDDTSSIKVNPGYKAILYENANFSGWSVLFQKGNIS